MLETIEVNLGERRFDARQQFFWSKAAGLFRWCEWDLRSCVERLHASERKSFLSGSTPARLLEMVRADLSERLRSGLSWSEHIETVRKTLNDPQDLAAWMNSPIGKLNKLPKRIRNAVEKAEKMRCEELHDEFFAEIDVAHTSNYIQVSQSAGLAGSILISLARGELTIDELDQKRNEKEGRRRTGGLSVLSLNDKRWVLRQVEIYGRLNGSASGTWARMSRRSSGRPRLARVSMSSRWNKACLAVRIPLPCRHEHG